MTMSRIAPDALISGTAFDASGLVPVIAQDADTGVVRMFAWANREALIRTTETGQAHFWSRSRQTLWRKGETSGNELAVRQIRLDCDGDVVLYLVDATGPSCHTGRTSCFYRRGDADGWAEDDGPPDPPAVIITRVAAIIARRRRQRPENSYVVSLLDAGWPKILGKILEETGELVDALTEGDRPHTAHEAADVLFHILVGLEAAGVSVDDVFTQLRRRFGVSGLDEKAGRMTADLATAKASNPPPSANPSRAVAPKPPTRTGGRKK
jgi:phosphoribosyl-ATP pyrophosphohydrolase/phosphoribosyl-AMP cyclohydrolase